MKKIHIFIITFTLLCAACNPQPSHSAKAISTEDAQSKSRIDTTLLVRIFWASIIWQTNRGLED